MIYDIRQLCGSGGSSVRDRYTWGCRMELSSIRANSRELQWCSKGSRQECPWIRLLRWYHPCRRIGSWFTEVARWRREEVLHTRPIMTGLEPQLSCHWHLPRHRAVAASWQAAAARSQAVATWLLAAAASLVAVASLAVIAYQAALQFPATTSAAPTSEVVGRQWPDQR